jgi:hypothetical protein
MGVARALRIAGGTAQQPKIVTGLPNGVSAFTFSCRSRTSDATALLTPFYLTTAAEAEVWRFGWGTSDYASWMRDEGSTGPHVTQTLTNDTWAWWAFRFDNGASPKVKVWFALDGGSVYTATGDAGSIAGQTTELWLAQYHASLTQDISEVKMWLSALTDGEVEAERSYVVPQKTGTWAWYGMDSDTLATCFTDDSGNGHTLEATVNPTVIAGAGTTWDAAEAGGSPGSVYVAITL